jgi:hypothetical protein
MTGTLGMIEWIQNTKPIKACIEDEFELLSEATSASRGVKKSVITLGHVQAKHMEWFAKVGGGESLGIGELFFSFFFLYFQLIKSCCSKKPAKFVRQGQNRGWCKSARGIAAHGA